MPVRGFCGFISSTEDKSTILQDMMEKIDHRNLGKANSVLPYEDSDIAIGFHHISEGSKILTYDGPMIDGEKLLHLYEKYGSEMLSHLCGAFAFAIWDAKKKLLFAARDHFGAKPFYYSHLSDSFLFASEIKSFLAHPNFTPELNAEALSQYLSFQYSALPETFFKGVFKLPAGHYMVYKDEQIELTKYFSPKFNPQPMSLEKAIDTIDTAVCNSIELQTDTETGTFLSGGVDSSYIAARFTGKKCFTVGFDYKNYNEISYAKTLADELGLEHHARIITAEEYWESLPKIQYQMDEPMADPAAVTFYFACQEASQHVKIALSGEGPDEFFGGYNIYKEPLSLKPLTVLPRPLRKLLAKLASALPFEFKGKNFFIRGSKTVEERFVGNANIFSKKEREQILIKDAGKAPQNITASIYNEAVNQDDITKMQHLDIRMWLTDDILLQADKMSAIHSLELRTPILNKEIFKIASQLPTDLRVNKRDTKYAFRQAAAKHLPESWAKRKKLGFPTPIRIWLREDKYYNIVKSYFTGKISEKYFKTEALLNLLDEHKSLQADNSRKIWTVLMFLLWHEQYLVL